MCGIAGIVGTRASEFASAVEAMADAMSHRGPDAKGRFASADGDCLMGHRRLSIIDVSCGANQPMLAPDGSAIVYNGECYNFRELRVELTSAGQSFVTHSDTEVVLHLLRTGGVGALPRINGMFALAYWDHGRRRLIVARDRFGQKPLYYACVSGNFIFASEIRSLLAGGLVRRRLNRRALPGYLTFGCVQEPDTIIDGVRLLPAGSYMEIAADGSVATPPTRYWDFPREKIAIDPSEIRSRFLSAVGRHMVSDVPIGVFLSGGIDSSAVAAAAVRCGNDKVVTLGVAYPEFPDQDESPHAWRVARHIGSDHREVPLTAAKIKESLPAYLDHLDQPSVDGFNTYLISWAARQAGLTVALSGLGGDELFGGYAGNFRGVERAWRRVRAIGPAGIPLAAMASAMAGRRSKFAKLAEYFRAKSYLDIYLTNRKTTTGDRLATMADRSEYADATCPRMRWYRDEIAGRDIHDAIGVLEMTHYMGQQLLRDADVNGMAHSLEIRVPFLDGDFSASVLAGQSDLRTVTNVPKHALVDAISDFLPMENVIRAKQGFTIPLAQWMRSDLRDDLRDGIGAAAAFMPSATAKIFRDDLERFFRRTRSIRWSQLWAAFVLGRYIDKERLSVD